MVPNGTAYSNFPPFATNGTKTPPGGSPESAKYALGMVPADTFPAEWANYLFHGATAGITRLNQDTGSIKKEINSVLSNYNITPDATDNDQLLEALTKLKAEAALAAHPVGSLYWTSSTENPAVTFGGGTWVQIKDKFILAAGDTYSNGATGGSATVTLTAYQIPGHTHSGTTAVNNVGHTHNMQHTHSFELGLPLGADPNDTTPRVPQYYKSYAGAQMIVNGNTNYASEQNTGDESTSHTHTFTTDGGQVGGEAHNNMPPYIVRYCWERTA